MASIEYQSDFKHTDWIDNVSRVKAGGDDGFNVHFHDIEDEFGKLSTVVKTIKDRTDQLAEKPPATPIAVTLTPVLTITGLAGWEHVAGSARKPANATTAAGTMSVLLPDGVRVQTLRAVGECSGPGIVVVQLRRQKLDPTAGTELVAGLSATGGTFDAKNPPPAGAPVVVDTTNFRYYVTAQVTNAQANDLVRLDAFQIVHISQ